MSRCRNWLTFPLVVLGLISCVQGVPTFEKSSFSRFVSGERNGEGELQTAIVTYRNNQGVKVSLVAAVHVGDGAYYDLLDKYFESQDAVLFELIAPPGHIPGSANSSTSLLSIFQRAIKNFLELEFQLDAIDYTCKNFVHADMTPEEFLARQAERGESLLGLMFKLMLEEWKQAQKGKASNFTELHLLAALLSDDHARSLKFLLAQELERLETVLAGFGEGDNGQGSVILTERNKTAIKVLKKELKSGKKRLSIFYGAAHMPDLEERLIRLGFKKQSQSWVTAWDVRSKPGKTD